MSGVRVDGVDQYNRLFLREGGVALSETKFCVQGIGDRERTLTTLLSFWELMACSYKRITRTSLKKQGLWTCMKI